jgi:hypothetical protein
VSVEETSTDSSGDNNTYFIIGMIVVVVAVIVVIAGVIYNKQKIGKSSNPSAQQAALTVLNSIPVKGPAPKTGYSREQFGKPWTDDVDVEGGHNGCLTRDDILRRDLSNVVPARGCEILSGVLHDPYTGKDVPFNREEGTDVLVQIDHIVPLLDAWQTGAQQWDLVKRTQFANDPAELLAVSGKANRKKKAGDVATWLPSNKDYRCEYVTKFVKVIAQYGLWMVQSEHDEAARVLSKCSSQTPTSSGSPRSSGVLPSVGTRFPSSSAIKHPG